MALLAHDYMLTSKSTVTVNVGNALGLSFRGKKPKRICVHFKVSIVVATLDTQGFDSLFIFIYDLL